MENIEKRAIYSQSSFDEMLDNSDKLVLEVVEHLKTIYPEKKYKIISSFDNHKKGIINIEKESLTEEEENILQIFIDYRFGKNFNKDSEIVKDYLFKEQNIKNKILNGMRGHDIAVIKKKNKKIVELIECKDFPQLIYFSETGLPVYYFFKLTFLKMILEKRQNKKIKQTFIFKDNTLLKENRKNKNIDIPIIENPYGISLELENFKGKIIKKNRENKPILSHFLNKYKNNNDIPISANFQFTWDVFKEMKSLENLFKKEKLKKN